LDSLLEGAGLMVAHPNLLQVFSVLFIHDLKSVLWWVSLGTSFLGREVVGNVCEANKQSTINKL